MQIGLFYKCNWYNLQDYEGAIAEYTKALEINPKDAMALISRGLTKQYIKDYKGAVADFSQTIKVRRNCPMHTSIEA